MSASLAVALALASRTPPCPPVPVIEDGRVRTERCAADAVAEGYTLVDLADTWVPRALRDTAYAPTWRALADGRVADAPGAGPRAATDAFFEPWGIAPTLRRVRERLRDPARHGCHSLVDDRPLAALTADLAPGAKARDAVAALQGHLVCDGLLDPRDADGGYGGATARALGAWQRMEGLLSGWGVLGAEARERLLLGSDTRDLAALRRAVQERVVDAQALIEDGSAAGVGGPPDVIGAATEAAMAALGLSSPAAARASLDALPWQGVVALALPPPPSWHSPAMALSARIDRGATTASGMPLARGPRPSLRLLATVDGREVPLVSWPTTIGGVQREKVGELIVLREKPSPTGVFAWRWLWAAPAWYPPPSTPDDELLLRTAQGVRINEEGIGPSYRSAYGLVMLQHHQADPRRVEGWADTGVRTHGTGDVDSVLGGGVSHGCHRLLPQHALRLGGFLLAHRAHGPLEEVVEPWSRDVRAGGRVLQLERKVRGARVELTPPVEVVVIGECSGEG